MDDAIGLIIALVLLALLVGGIILPIVALVVSIRTRNKLSQQLSRLQASSPLPPAEGQGLSQILQELTARVARLEAALLQSPVVAPAPETARGEVEGRPQLPTPPPPPIAPPPRMYESPAQPDPAPFSATTPARTINAQELESIIGRRWLGWAAVALILFATAFFLKYAFDNRWIGELGRVAIGVAAGVTLAALGYRYHKRQWRVFSQILSAGGVVLLYLSAYASFGYYHLATQKVAFAYMTILIAEAAALALLYEAPAIAVMALIGAFLNPILLRSDRDQYRSLFGYIFALDVGTLALLKQWPGLSSLAFFGTHLLFWLWYGDNYHPRKLAAVMVFQTAVFLAFLSAHLARRFLKREQVDFDHSEFTQGPLKFVSIFEDFWLLVINPYAFFATSYFLLNGNHHDWIGVFAIGMALVYAGAAKLLLDRRATTRAEMLLMIGVALTFVTLAIPIQLKSNWITIAWAVEGVAILWTGIEMKSQRLRAIAHALFALAVLKLVFWDTPWGYRATFTPVVNKYFLSSLFVIVCLFASAWIYEKLGERMQIPARVFQLVLLVVALITLWFLLTVETYTYFASRAALQKTAEAYQHEHWLGQMALSVLWSVYAAVLAAVGFVRRSAAIRWAALSLFALTVVKVMLVDIAVLQQLYRIIAFLVLGLLLLVVTWGYHRAFYSKESST